MNKRVKTKNITREAHYKHCTYIDDHELCGWKEAF